MDHQYSNTPPPQPPHHHSNNTRLRDEYITSKGDKIRKPRQGREERVQGRE
jgi:hypothetical protein